MFGRKKLKRSLENARAEREMTLQANRELQAKIKEARLTIGLLLDARLTEVVRPKRLMRECIDPTLKKRAFSAINRRPDQ